MSEPQFTSEIKIIIVLKAPKKISKRLIMNNLINFFSTNPLIIEKKINILSVIYLIHLFDTLVKHARTSRI